MAITTVDFATFTEAERLLLKAAARLVAALAAMPAVGSPGFVEWKTSTANEIVSFVLNYCYCITYQFVSFV